MGILKSKRSGGLMVSENVLIKISEVAATDVPGVHGIAERNYNLGVMSFKFGTRPIRVRRINGALVVDVIICIDEDAVIPDVCKNVQNNIKSAIQNMTGKPVSKVNIVIDDIYFADDAEQAEENSEAADESVEE